MNFWPVELEREKQTKNERGSLGISGIAYSFLVGI
jgi:hypothetical protein